MLGIGLGRTGTASLKLALEQLGFGPCHHMLELFQRPGDAALWQARARGEAVGWDALLGGFRSTVDWPSVHFWRELVRDFPDAKVDPHRARARVPGTTASATPSSRRWSNPCRSRTMPPAASA